MSTLVTQQEIETNFPVPATTLMNERGGAWMGTIHSWIQRNALNGETVIWGTNDFLRLKDQTVLDMELLAANIAASAVAETRRDYLNYFRHNKPSGLQARDIHGDNPTIVTKGVRRLQDGGLDHDFCVGAHSWIEGGIVFGQGKFLSYGAWSEECKHCTHQHKLDSAAAAD